ncbi:MAG: nucleoside triphosphate pyrophosphohydrolase [Spirochaetia bacterium]|nr:nucleoside triphosphate pyrophosphohydrolase [Spirochaetia bacterium]
MITYSFERKETFQESITALYEIITLLRSEDGCPWDREQTPKSVSTAIIDETYEYIDALLDKDIQLCKEEIGDVLLNVLMTSRIHEEYGEFSPIDSINDVCEKLIRRHPHVFSNANAENTDEVLELWNKVKVEVEGKTHTTENIFSRIPKKLPELEHAVEMQKAMKKVGFDWPDINGVIEKIEEELGEAKEAIVDIKQNKDHVEEEIGDLLFSVVNLARYAKINPSLALRRCNHKVTNRFNDLAIQAKKEDIDLTFDNSDLLNKIWETIKSKENLP